MVSTKRPGSSSRSAPRSSSTRWSTFWTGRRRIRRRPKVISLLVDALLTLLALLGHFSLCVWLFNRLHALPWQRFYIKGLGRAILLWGAAVLAVYGRRG